MSELAYLGSALLVSVIGSLVVWRRQRQPRSLESGVEHFARGLQALSSPKDIGSRRSASRK